MNSDHSQKQSFDERLAVENLARGNNDAFDAVYNNYYSEVNQFVLRYVKSPQLAEDLSQEIFIKVWERRANLAEVRSFRSWLFVVARNHTLNTLKSAAHKQDVVAEITRHTNPKSSSPVEDELLSREYLRYLNGILDTLPPKAREVFRLCREQHKSYDEVAAILGISRNTVKSHMAHSLKILRDSVEKDLGISLSLFLLIVLHSS